MDLMRLYEYQNEYLYEYQMRLYVYYFSYHNYQIREDTFRNKFFNPGEFYREINSLISF